MSSESAPKLELPPELQPFVIDPEKLSKVECLGTGSYSEVWKGIYNNGEDKHPMVAIKYLKQFATHDWITGFMREISTVVCIKHPAIVPLIGFVADVKEPILVHELMVNDSLEKIRKRRENRSATNWPLPTARVACIFYGVAHAMACLHAHNVIHRDLKPANILLAKEHRPCIGDFGCARFLNVNGSSALSVTGIGSRLYMAPEIMTNNRSYTNKVDVYSFGVTIWALFETKEWTMDDGNRVLQMPDLLFQEAIVSGKRFTRPKNIPDCYWNLACECWNGNPDERPTFADIVQKMQKPEFASWPKLERRNVEWYEAYQRELSENDHLMKK